jgi:hypothetical protein
MATISINDTIMASASLRGTTLATINASGFASEADVMSSLRKKVGTAAGLISVTLRNFSQGWSRQHSLYISRPSLSLRLS